MESNDSILNIFSFRDDMYRVSKSERNSKAEFIKPTPNEPKQIEHPITSLYVNISIMCSSDYLFLKALLYGIHLGAISSNSHKFRIWVYECTADEEVIRRTGRPQDNNICYIMCANGLVERCIQELDIIKEYLMDDPYEVFDSIKPEDYIRRLDVHFNKNKEKYLRDILDEKPRPGYLLL